MEAIRSLLSHVRTTGIAPGHFPGLLHVLIGRTITQMNGEVVSRGVTWRECAALLKNARIDPDLVRSLGQDPAAFLLAEKPLAPARLPWDHGCPRLDCLSPTLAEINISPDFFFR